MLQGRSDVSSPTVLYDGTILARNRVGLRIGIYPSSLPIYSTMTTMTIFHNLSVIDVGIEVVPVKELAMQMSTGVSYFEQFVWDLEHRGVADIDIPVLVLGIAP